MRKVPVSLPSLDPATCLAALPPGPGQFLLESGRAGPHDVRRFSFAGAEPFCTLVTRGRTAYIHEEGRTRVIDGDPFVILQSLLNTFRLPVAADMPPFAGGAVGYFAYDLGRQVEQLPTLAEDDLGLPELYIGFYDAVLVIDHEASAASVMVGAPDGREADAMAKAGRWIRALKQSTPLPPLPPLVTAGPLRSSLDRGAYVAAVRRALEYIAAGDIFQVNLAHRLSCAFGGTGWQLYQALRESCPAPFAAYMDGGSWQVVSSSPERFVSVSGRSIETRPIKGTRPRGTTEADDEARRSELLASEKDAAELAMIVDLERNDLGKVCEYGSVTVPDLRRVEGTPQVWHTVATVEGRLRSDVTAAQLLRATFPGGSITGAPKVRAMEIIEELEPVRRGVYTGAIGYIGFDGRLDLNIAIRTVVVKDGAAHFHVGGGIVADSEPTAEYAETLAKGRGIARALGVHLDDLP